MCDKHTHSKIEEWVTPINSQYLSSKMVHLFPGDHVHAHSTGPGREEVLVILFGSVTVTLNEKTKRTYHSGETCFIPAETLHEVSNDDAETPAQYCYCVTKKQPADVADLSWLLFNRHPAWRN